MRVLIIGAGAVGTVVGGRLAAAGHDVALLARPETAAAIAAHGLSVRGPDPGQRVAAPARAFTGVAEAVRGGFEPDLVIVCVKAYDTPGVASLLGSQWPGDPAGAGGAAAGGSPPVVLTLQNGVGNEEALAAAVGGGRVVGGALTASVSLIEAGVARQNTRGGAGVAPYGPATGGPAAPALNPDAARLCADALAGAGFRVTTAPDHRSLKWSKLLLNMWANTTCAILDLPAAGVLGHPGLFALELAAFREAVRAMRRAGIPIVDLPGYPVRLVRALFSILPAPILRRTLGQRMGGARGEKLPSLLIDARRGRRQSEADVLHGAVARLAQETGGDAPTCAFLQRTLAACLEAGSRAEFSACPGRLLAAWRSARDSRQPR
jgi:2-dehydropantoate 2-reductase